MDFAGAQKGSAWFQQGLRVASPNFNMPSSAAAQDFHVVLRGGLWTFKHTGKEADSARGEASHREAEQMCCACGLQKSFTASLAAYGDDQAMLLCKAWVAKMQYMYNLYSTEGPGFQFTAEMLSDFEEDPAVEQIHVAGGQALRRRIEQIRALKPRT